MRPAAILRTKEAKPAKNAAETDESALPLSQPATGIAARLTGEENSHGLRQFRSERPAPRGEVRAERALGVSHVRRSRPHRSRRPRHCGAVFRDHRGRDLHWLALPDRGHRRAGCDVLRRRYRGLPVDPVTAALSLCLGVLLLYKPGTGAAALTLALTAFFVAEGVFQVVTSLAYRKALPDAWVWLLASGVCDLILVAIIVYSWPLSAAWKLGLLAGVNLLTSGCAFAA